MTSSIRQAYERHVERRAARDWSGLADCFAPDARYFDPIFGWTEGREGIRGFLERAMAGLADRTFTDLWHVAEGDRLVIYWQCSQPDVEGDDELYHGMSALLHAGNGLWQEQMDVYDREQAMGSRARASRRP